MDTPSEGAMVYVKCLSPDVINYLCASDVFNIPGWSTYGVTDQLNINTRLSTADCAVEFKK